MRKMNGSMSKHPLAVLGLAMAIGGALTCAASAEPLVKMEGGKPAPGVVTKWSANGTTVELTLKEGEDPQAVADAIKTEVGKVRTSVRDGKVIVVGKSEADLLNALSKVEVGGEDFGALADAALSDEGGEGSGSSLRAKKVADLDKMFKDKDKLALGTVVGVSYGQYPSAVVTVKIIGAPKGPLGNKVRRGANIKFRPLIKMKGTSPDWADDGTQVNAGAWYLKAKDRVRVLIGGEAKDVYEAVAIDRQ